MNNYSCIECCALDIFKYLFLKDIIYYCYKKPLSNKKIHESLIFLIKKFKMNTLIYQFFLKEKISTDELKYYPIFFLNKPFRNLTSYFFDLFKNNNLYKNGFFIITKLNKPVFLKKINNEKMLFIMNVHYDCIYYFILEKNENFLYNKSGYLYINQSKTNEFEKILKYL